MSDRFSGWIKIGGDIPEALATDLLDAICEEQCGLSWGHPLPKVETLAELLDASDREGGGPYIVLQDTEARYGHFEDLEGFLKRNDIPYDRGCDAYCEYNAEVAFWRPGMQTEDSRETTVDGDPYVLYAPVKKAFDALMRGNFTVAMDRLAPLMQTEVPPLPFLRII